MDLLVSRMVHCCGGGINLDCASNRIGQVAVPRPKGLYTHKCAVVYGARHDVCVALIPARVSGPVQTFLVRFDPRHVK